MVEIKNVTKIFNADNGPDELKVALDNISLTINDGDFITVIGGNGSGKTTLMNTIAGTYIPEEGSIVIDGDDVTKCKEFIRAKYVGRVFQDPKMGTCASMSLLENMELASRRGKKPLLKWGFNKNNTEMYIEDLKRLNLGLEDRLNTKISLFSGGQRQAVTLLMATMNHPKILLLDEHTAALDPKTANIVLTLTDEIVREEKLTTLMITHNMRDALKYGNRLIMMNNGKVVLDISGEEKKNLTVNDLLAKFEQNPDIELNDKMLLN